MTARDDYPAEVARLTSAPACTHCGGQGYTGRYSRNPEFNYADGCEHCEGTGINPAAAILEAAAPHAAITQYNPYTDNEPEPF